MKHKNYKKIFIIISIIVTIILIAGLWLFFNTDFFRTKRGTFFRYFETTKDALSLLDTSDFTSYNNAKETKTYIRKAEMNILSSNNIADSNILDKIKMTLTEKNDYKNEKANVEISIKSSNQELATISYIRDKNVYGIYCPLVSNGYVSIRNENLKQLTTNLEQGSSITVIGSIIEKLGLKMSDIIPNEVMPIKMDKVLEITKIQQSHIDSYYKIIKNNVPNNAYTKNSNDKIKIEETNYKVNSYILSLEEKDSANLEIALLEKLSQDSIMMDFITSKAKLLNMNEEYTDINTLNQKMQNKILELKANPIKAEKFEMIVSEYKQKNIQTKIKIGNNTFIINHIKDDNGETSIFTINDTSFKINKKESTYTIKISTVADDTNKSIEIVYNKLGDIENNNITNTAKITLTNGIKTIVFNYNDQVNFTDDIGSLENFSGNNIVVLNEFNSSKVNEFIKNLKIKINQVYVNKGSTIGINLDPIFE